MKSSFTGQGKALFACLVVLLLNALSIDVAAQCPNAPAPFASSQSACPGLQSITFNATSNGTTVGKHQWYNSNMTPVSVGTVTQHAVVLTQGGPQTAWTSSYTISLSANATFYVAAGCGSTPSTYGTPTQVTYTVQTPNTIGLAMSPASNPADLCVGETITLTASGGSNYEWRLNSPTDPSFTTGTTKTATVSGTYYLKGTDNCSQQQTRSIVLNFKQNLFNVTLSGPDNRCQVTVDDQYTAAGSNVDLYAWSISDNDPAANATMSSTGKATWNNTVADATVQVIAYGCHGTSVTKTKNVTVTRSPYNMQISTTQANFCMGSVVDTKFNVTGSSFTDYIWESVTGTGNVINRYTGLVTWSPTFTGTATITGRAYGCGSSNAPSTATLTAFQKPTAVTTPSGPISIPFGTPSISLSATTGTGYNYEWLNNDSPFGQTASTLSVGNTGSYSVRIVDANNCTAKSAAVNVTLESNYNYVISNVLQAYQNDNGTTIAESDIRNLATQKKTEQINFIDGLGKSMQVVTTKASPGGLDLVQPVIYDAFDREVAKVLPVALGNTGAYKVGIIDNSTYQYQNGALSFYAVGSDNKIADDTKPFAKTVFEPSPLNRVIEQGSPGQAWQPDATDSYASTDKTRKFTYEANTATDVIRWTYTPPTFPSPTYLFGVVTTGTGTTPDYYPINQLYKTKTKDEDGNESIEYKDKDQKVVLKQVQAPTGWAQTYYIYDDSGILVCVIAPEGTSRLATEFYQAGATDATKNAFLDRWAFRYVYDFRKRLSVKQVPGAKPVYMVYDVRNRVVLTQDANQRTDAAGATTKKEWTYTKYDAFNRAVITGIYTHASVIDQYNMQIYVNGQMTGGNKLYEDFDGTTTNEGYTNRVFPTTSVTLLSVQYFDNYTFKSTWPTTFNYVNDALSTVITPVTYTQPVTASTQVYGLPTGKKIKVLDGGLWGSPWLRTVIYYDDKSRAVQSITDNQKVGLDRTSTLYDFAGKVLRTKTVQTNWALPLRDLVLTTATPTKVTSTNTVLGWNQSGAASKAVLAAGQNGWAETVIGEITSFRIFGLSDINTDNNYTTMDYAIYLHGSVLEIIENGVSRGAFTPALTVGEVLRAERNGSIVTYKRNGITFYTSTVPSTTQLLVDMTFYSLNSTINAITTSFSGGTTEINRRFEYDHAGRLVSTWHRLNTEPEILLAYNVYNELGQLVDKKLHSTVTTAADAKQSVDYRYNIRGWLTSINDASLTLDGAEPKDYFGMELGYNAAVTGITSNQLFNGNISAAKWSAGLGGGTIKENAYTYTYDVMNRLQSSTYNEKTTAWSTPAAGTLAETGFTYDLNGNIKGLTRNDKRSSGTMDLLVYDYGSGAAATNKLLKVTDGGDDFTGFIDGTNTTDDYTYDANGNMITDQNKGITTPITYNYLNLPETVSRGANTIRYIYDATGRKLSQVTTYGGSVRQVDYDGELQYDENALQFINHEEGRIVVAKTKLIYLNTGETTSGVTTLNAALTGTFVLNGEKYLKAVASAASSSRSGLSQIGGVFSVTPLARYKVRIKGFRDKGTAGSSSAAYMLLKSGLQELSWPGANLPAALTTGQTESWTEQVVTIPAGETTLQVGMLWPTVLNGEIMYLNDVEITKLEDIAPEYQYNLKDHLGNVRVTFTTKAEVDQSLATLEVVNAAQEQSQFIYYDEAVKINSPLFDHTEQAGSNPGVFFYRGINFNGPATVIDGNPWVAGATAANFTWTGAGSFENQNIPLTPVTDANRTTMLRASIYGDVNMTMTSVPNGTYDIYLSVWEDSTPQDYYINVEGVQRLADFYSGASGTWSRLGPFRAVIADGNINVFASGVCNISGLEVWTVTQAAGNQAPVVNAYFPDQTAQEGQAYSYQFPLQTFIDPDPSATLTYTAIQSSGSALPTWLTFNATTRTLSGTPTVGSAGYLDIRVTASDGLGGTTSDVFMLAITSSAATTFFRGVNLNGPAITVDANSWLASASDANFAYTSVNGVTFENQAVTLIPATDANRATMIRSSIYGPNVNLMFNAIPSGIYDVSIYVWEDNASENFTVAVEGINVITNFNSGPAGTWTKLGPYRRIINDGTLNIIQAGGGANFSGVEIKTVSTSTVPVTGITISPSPFNVLIGKSAQLSRTISPANASNKNILWTSSNTAVALVNKDGWVTGVSAGTSTITATLNGFSSQVTANITNTPSSYSTRLNGTANEKYGLAKSLSVMPGDVITMEVFAKYIDTNTTNWNAALTNLINTIAAGTAPNGTYVDGGATGSIGGTAFPYPTTLVRTGDTGTGPKAYLNYLIFDKNFVYKNGGFKRLSATPKETGTDVAHERLAFDGAQQITITEAGYVYIYLSNENPTAVEVYFDDFKVTQTKGPIVGSQDYYPFGLTFNSYQRENSLLNKFKFQGQEHTEDLGLNWDSFKWRNHQPDIGRFFNVDPLTEKYLYNSPYAFSENRVVAHIELEGREALSIENVDPAARVRSEYAKMDDKIVESPVSNPVISSEFGPRIAPIPGASTNHPGIDIVKKDATQTSGSDIVAPVNGKVISIKSAADGNGAGNRVAIKANVDGKVHKFFHMQTGFAKDLKINDNISRGTKIGTIGTTGNSQAPHLHYEVRDGQTNTALNPRNENPGLTNAPTTEEARSSPPTPPKPGVVDSPIPIIGIQ